jgi:hypothetical protein
LDQVTQAIEGIMVLVKKQLPQKEIQLKPARVLLPKHKNKIIKCSFRPQDWVTLLLEPLMAAAGGGWEHR